MIRRSRKKSLIVLAGILFWISCSSPVKAQSDWEFYLFGLNMRSFRGCSIYQVISGAAASILAHELGHALYLEISGKSWDIQASVPAGLAVSTPDALEDAEYRNFGRAGFLVQMLTGTGLAAFEKTRAADFTKGWVAMSAAQLYS